MKIAILAAGFSSRLGQSKALARIHGVSLLRRTLQTLRAAGLPNVIVIAPENAHRYRREARGLKAAFVPNSHRARGLSSSVGLAVGSARGAAALLLLPVDLAHLSPSDLRRLAACWRSRPHDITAAANSARGGSPLILPRRHFPKIASLQGDVGVRALLAGIPPAAIRLVPMRSAGFDIDTLEQLAAARRDFRRH